MRVIVPHVPLLPQSFDLQRVLEGEKALRSEATRQLKEVEKKLVSLRSPAVALSSPMPAPPGSERMLEADKSMLQDQIKTHSAQVHPVPSPSMGLWSCRTPVHASAIICAQLETQQVMPRTVTEHLAAHCAALLKKMLCNVATHLSSVSSNANRQGVQPLPKNGSVISSVTNQSAD